MIVFSRQIGDRGSLFVGRGDGSDAVQITDGPDDYNPQWSPDGRRIVFERSIAEDDTAVWIVNADGTGPRELDSGPFAEHPRWSPNGRWVAFQVQTSESVQDTLRANTTYELWLIRPNGSGLRLLLENGMGEVGDENSRYYVHSGAWAWSPDSRRIAFIRPRPHADEARGGVQIVDIANGNTRYLGSGVDAAWSPDGRRLAVTTNDEGVLGGPECGTVWVLTVGTAKRRRLAPPQSTPCDRFPRWSPDGRAMVFQRSSKSTAFLEATPDGGRLRSVARLRAAAYRWPDDCTRLFEYVTPLEAGWIVSGTRGKPRFVGFPIPNGDWRCTSTRAQSN